MKTISKQTSGYGPAEQSRPPYKPLVDQMLALHKQLADTKTPHDQTAIQRQIDATYRQTDNLVYELYGRLTEEEIKIIESNTIKTDL